MSISIQDLQKLATDLSNGAGECEWRSAASRGYYSMFHKALEVADACLPPNPYAQGEHEKLTDRLKQEGRKGMSLAYRLIDQKKVRTKADYKLSEAFKQADATDLIANCPSIYQQADELLAHVNGQKAANP
ncbi:hypothetical protein [Burkholderia seminalis]|uniref:hypothetical protein n=1 Tax=Burkholderia seminalis TaxID=488731 RepID=UPI00264C4853|nr:hypothetical protein [Burkholderia seminalis]MDN7851370.1 hypothetical protein [Burkholderia seminalis]